jgi:hypothetical protein
MKYLQKKKIPFSSYLLRLFKKKTLAVFYIYVRSIGPKLLCNYNPVSSLSPASFFLYCRTCLKTRTDTHKREERKGANKLTGRAQKEFLSFYERTMWGNKRQKLILGSTAPRFLLHISRERKERKKKE